MSIHCFVRFSPGTQFVFILAVFILAIFIHSPSLLCSLSFSHELSLTPVSGLFISFPCSRLFLLIPPFSLLPSFFSPSILLLLSFLPQFRLLSPSYPPHFAPLFFIPHLPILLLLVLLAMYCFVGCSSSKKEVTDS